MKKYIIISHSHCTDGLCSASLMKKALQLAYGSDTNVYEKFGGRADEKINCLKEDSHIHVSTKSEVKAILDAYVWIVINKKG